MIFALIFFLALGVLATVGPASVLGLVTGLLAARLTVPVRTGLLLVVAAAQSTVWGLLLPSGYLVPAVVFLVCLATLASGAGGVAWAAHRSRAVRYPGGQPVWHPGTAGW
ncbi:hypothetical protein F4556_000150 [Kitasatospora gansuensis]|uniref:Uncharacterized protein n=1 Tax=Kitasatospora gansuensis TaxID=258050 RepID=A0A7W7S663_9ACTN|nr:hypothetical protein [Kitasatospora gansuensis]MBB4944615.1 hypothetical protein [Kitasatospora gansuensis]